MLVFWRGLMAFMLRVEVHIPADIFLPVCTISWHHVPVDCHLYSRYECQIHRNVTVCEGLHFISFYRYCQTVVGEWLYQGIQQTKFLFT